jgi:hypothetical protein
MGDVLIPHVVPHHHHRHPVRQQERSDEYGACSDGRHIVLGTGVHVPLVWSYVSLSGTMDLAPCSQYSGSRTSTA